jgi:hypothetical protein
MRRAYPPARIFGPLRANPKGLGKTRRSSQRRIGVLQNRKRPAHTLELLFVKYGSPVSACSGMLR